MKPLNHLTIRSALGRHEKVALQISDGVDSLAVLFALEQYWGELTVVWLDTGDAPEETVGLMASVKELVPNFLHVHGDVHAVRQQFGLPVDLLPASCTELGQSITGSGPLMQTRYECCARSFWMPLDAAMREAGFTLFIRGQRDDDVLRTKAGTGTTDEGREVLFPIEHWTRQDVFDYLAEIELEVPAMYDFGGASLDCLGCTAYLGESDRGGYLQAHAPERYEEYRRNLIAISNWTRPHVTELMRALGGY